MGFHQPWDPGDNEFEGNPLSSHQSSTLTPSFFSPLRKPTDIAVAAHSRRRTWVVFCTGQTCGIAAQCGDHQIFIVFHQSLSHFQIKLWFRPCYLSVLRVYSPVGVGGWLAKDLPATCTLIMQSFLLIMNHLEDSYDGDYVKYSIKKHMSHLRSLPRSSPMPSRFLKLHVGCAANFAVQPG